MKMAMNDNLARQYKQQQVDYTDVIQPQSIPSQTPGLSVKQTVGKNMFTRAEKMVMGLIGTSFVALCFGSIYMSSAVTSVSQEVQDLNSQITEIGDVNTNYEQNIQELSRYDRVHQIGQEHELTPNNANIRNVE